ncbi:MAG: hypothetical protein ACFFC6_16575 [Promethearchaeota archaeon]
MSPSNPESIAKSEKPSEKQDNYFERKYGKEPKITAEKYAQNRWNWH